MQDELSKAACERWCSRLNAELGGGTFGVGGVQEPDPNVVAVPRLWVPAKPKLTLGLLDEFSRASTKETPPQASLGSESTISKVLSRHVVEEFRKDKGDAWLAQSGELSVAQIDDHTKLNQALSR
eukprot:1042242-Prymnesium_polylepis.1